MIEKRTDSQMVALIGEEAFAVWKKLCVAIESLYDMRRLCGYVKVSGC